MHCVASRLPMEFIYFGETWHGWLRSLRRQAGKYLLRREKKPPKPKVFMISIIAQMIKDKDGWRELKMFRKRPYSSRTHKDGKNAVGQTSFGFCRFCHVYRSASRSIDRLLEIKWKRIKRSIEGYFQSWRHQTQEVSDPIRTHNCFELVQLHCSTADFWRKKTRTVGP